MSALGNRYSCIECDVKFYDLGKNKAICPACGTDQSAQVAVDAASAKKTKRATAPKATKGE